MLSSRRFLAASSFSRRFRSISCCRPRSSAWRFRRSSSFLSRSISCCFRSFSRFRRASSFFFRCSSAFFSSSCRREASAAAFSASFLSRSSSLCCFCSRCFSFFRSFSLAFFEFLSSVLRSSSSISSSNFCCRSRATFSRYAARTRCSNIRAAKIWNMRRPSSILLLSATFGSYM